MPDDLQTIVQRMVDAGEPESNIATVIRAYQPQTEPAAPPAGKGYLARAVDFAKQHPAAIGATIGGIAAVPLTGGASLIPAMAAAGLGGAGGAGLGMLAGAMTPDANVPSTAGGVLKTMGTQGGLQAAAEGGGRLISGALKAGAGRLYQSVLKPTLAARQQYPNLIKTGLENAIPVSKGGAEKAASLVGQSKDAADALVAARAAQPGAPMIDPRQAVGGITSAVQDVRQLPVSRPQMKAIGDYGRQYLAEHPSPLTLPDAQAGTRATDRFYNSAYRATMDRGNPVTAGNTAAAVGINDETRNLLRQAVPGLQEQNANTAALMGIKKAVERRAGAQANRSPIGMQHLINAGIGSTVGAFGGRDKGIETFLGAEALTNPATASRLAIATSRAGRAVPFSQLLRLALLGQMAGQDGSQ